MYRENIFLLSQRKPIINSLEYKNIKEESRPESLSG